MSKFWGGADSSSDDSSSDDSSVSSSDSSRGGAGGAGAGANRWVMESDSDSSDEERVVKSAKDRAFETFAGHVKAIRNAMRIKDFNKVQSEFEALNKAIAKGKAIINQHGGIPRFYIRLLCDLEDFVKTCLADKASFKKLSASNGRALNRMKLTLRKHNAQYAAVMEEYRKNPTVSSSESEAEESASSSDSSSDSDSEAADSDSDSDSDSDDDSSSSSSSSDDDSASGSDSVRFFSLVDRYYAMTSATVITIHSTFRGLEMNSSFLIPVRTFATVRLRVAVKAARWNGVCVGADETNLLYPYC